MEGFKITCNRCGNEINIEKEDVKGKDIHNFSFYPIQSTYVNINCRNCGNEIYVEEG